MLQIGQHHLKSAVAAIAVLLIGLAVIGGILHYSPVPYWDMWGGYLDFFVRASNGGWRIWWEQHNEHRIVLARTLFWMDLAWFQGTVWFLIVVNYVLAAISCAVFYVCLKERLSTHQDQDLIQLLALFLCAWLFSWSQNENFTWGFQSQFFLAQLVPLVTFFCLHKTVATSPRSGTWFIATCVFGITSLGTMANGVLVLPLAFLLAVLLRVNWRKSTTLGLLSVVGTALYFYDYHAINGHGSLRQTLINDPIGMIRYVLLYIGGPFYALRGRGETALLLAQAAGLFLILSSAFFAFQALRAPRSSSLPLALLTFILYVGGTAFGTAGGRLMFGLSQAVSSRYMTPALMAWAALLILYAPYLASAFARNRRRVLWPVLILLALMIPAQLKALRPDEGMQFQRKIAALALELRIHDQAQVNTVYPSIETALAFTEAPVNKNLSVFGHPPIKDANLTIGTTLEVSTPIECKGHVDSISAIPGESRYASIDGWVYEPTSNSVPAALLITNEQKKVIGYALAGQSRTDIATAVDERADRSGFKGYVLADQIGQPITILGNKPACYLKTIAPIIPFSVSKPQISSEPINVDTASVQQPNEWTGGDFDSSKPSGLKILGSYIHSDEDMGSVTLQISRGARFFYRSGPTRGRQLLEIGNKKEVSVILPASHDWILLDFSNTRLPETFSVTFTDAGSGWGEWSAIAIKE